MIVRSVFMIMLLVTTCWGAGCTLEAQGPETQSASPAAMTTEQTAPLFDNLGTYHRPITTHSPLAQRYFDQGMIFTFGFNHAEAIRSFREAGRLDRHCAICSWGVALALGPNINASMADEAVPEAYQALQQALEMAEHASEAEQGYIQALTKRYPERPVGDRHSLDVAYADAMRELAQRYPDDLDAATLYAESLMDTMPWNYWTPEGEPRPGTNEIIETLESVLARNPNHPGANHLYIHAVEAVHPERGVPAADRLRDLVPGVGHLVHMPAHIYLRVGRYDQASLANERAAKADESYFAQSLTQGLYPAMYYPHNIHFLWYSASLEGRDKAALDAARKLVNVVGEDQVRAQAGLEMFRPTPVYALAQFGKWDQLLSEPQPPEDFKFHLAMWHYARGLALAASGKLEEAEGEQAKLKKLSASEHIEALETATLAFPASRLVNIAQHTLAGEIARHRGRHDDMIHHFQAAVEIQDTLPYMEPPYWYVPARQFLGEAWLRTGRPGEAERVYREDLERNPRNGWSLFGLHESLHAQGKGEEAAETQDLFTEAWARATVSLKSSRF